MSSSTTYLPVWCVGEVQVSGGGIETTPPDMPRRGRRGTSAVGRQRCGSRRSIGLCSVVRMGNLYGKVNGGVVSGGRTPWTRKCIARHGNSDLLRIPQDYSSPSSVIEMIQELLLGIRIGCKLLLQSYHAHDPVTIIIFLSKHNHWDVAVKIKRVGLLT